MCVVQSGKLNAAMMMRMTTPISFRYLREATIPAMHSKNFNLPYFWGLEGGFSNTLCLIRQRASLLFASKGERIPGFHRKEWVTSSGPQALVESGESRFFECISPHLSAHILGSHSFIIKAQPQHMRPVWNEESNFSDDLLLSELSLGPGI